MSPRTQQSVRKTQTVGDPDRWERFRPAETAHGERIAARPSLRRARPDAVTEPGSTSHALADHTYRSQGTHAATVDDTKLHRQPVRPGLGGRAGPSCGPPAQATAGGRTAERTPAAAPPSPSTRCPARCARRTAPHVPCRPGRAGGRTGCRAPWPRSRPRGEGSRTSMKSRSASIASPVRADRDRARFRSQQPGQHVRVGGVRLGDEPRPP